MVFLRTGHQSISSVRLFIPWPALGKPNLRFQHETVCFLLQRRQDAAAPLCNVSEGQHAGAPPCHSVASAPRAAVVTELIICSFAFVSLSLLSAELRIPEHKLAKKGAPWLQLQSPASIHTTTQLSRPCLTFTTNYLPSLYSVFPFVKHI